MRPKASGKIRHMLFCFRKFSKWVFGIRIICPNVIFITNMLSIEWVMQWNFWFFFKCVLKCSEINQIHSIPKVVWNLRFPGNILKTYCWFPKYSENVAFWRYLIIDFLNIVGLDIFAIYLLLHITLNAPSCITKLRIRGHTIKVQIISLNVVIKDNNSSFSTIKYC